MGCHVSGNIAESIKPVRSLRHEIKVQAQSIETEQKEEQQNITVSMRHPKKLIIETPLSEIAQTNREQLTNSMNGSINSSLTHLAFNSVIFKHSNQPKTGSKLYKSTKYNPQDNLLEENQQKQEQGSSDNKDKENDDDFMMPSILEAQSYIMPKIRKFGSKVKEEEENGNNSDKQQHQVPKQLQEISTIKQKPNSSRDKTQQNDWIVPPALVMESKLREDFTFNKEGFLISNVKQEPQVQPKKHGLQVDYQLTTNISNLPTKNPFESNLSNFNTSNVKYLELNQPVLKAESSYKRSTKESDIRDTTDEIDIASIRIKMEEKQNEEVLDEGVGVFKVVIDIDFQRYWA